MERTQARPRTGPAGEAAAALAGRAIIGLCRAGLLAGAGFVAPAAAQITLDGTLGQGNAALAGPSYQIGAALGRQMGANLFHSFGRFDLATGESATFSGPGSVANVIGRVTGGSASSIDGTLRSTIPGANLYLVNPAGLVFGPNASLDVSGSFHAATADHLRFADGAIFSATNPSASTLTMAAPEAFGFLGPTAGTIRVDGSSLSVLPGKTLTLTGGDIAVSGGPPVSIGAAQGTIRIVAKTGAGEVPLAGDLANVAAGGTITLTAEAQVDVSGDGGGSLAIRAGTLDARDSFIFSDNDGARPSTDGILIAADRLTVRNSKITTDVLGTGKGATVTVRAGTVELLEGGQLRSSTFSAGDAGAVVVTADHVLAAGNGAAIFTGIASTSEPGATGRAGDVTVQAPRIELVRGGAIAGFASGIGAGGTLDVIAGELLVSRDGASLLTGLSSTATEGSTGAAGSVSVAADRVTVQNGGSISSSTLGLGAGGTVRVTAGTLTLRNGGAIDSSTVTAANAGEIRIQADQIDILGQGSASGAVSGIQSLTNGTGNAGTVAITANRLAIDGKDTPDFTGVFNSSINSEADPSVQRGDAGSITVFAPQIQILNGGEIQSATFSVGNAGTIAIAARRLLVAGDGTPGIVTGISTSAEPGSRGDAGNITIAVSDLELRRGGAILSAVVQDTTGDAGTIAVQADRILIAGDEAPVFTGLFGTATNRSAGRAGSIAITGGSISVTGGGTIESTNFGTGLGGDVRIVVTGDVALTGQSRVGDASRISARSGGVNLAGTIAITANSLTIEEGAAVTTESAQAAGGQISLALADMLYIRDASLTTSVALGGGGGGDIVMLRPQFLILNEGTIRANAFAGPGGNMALAADNILRTPGSAITASSTLNVDGTIVVTAAEIDVSGGLIQLRGDFLDASRLARDTCADPGRATSSLARAGRGGLPAEAEEAGSGTYVAAREGALPAAALAPVTPGFSSGLLLASARVGCR